MSQSWAMTRTRHGTQSGWRLHQTLGERPCDACIRAKQEYDRRWRSAEEQVIKNRRSSRAQGMANKALKARYPDEYRALYTAALAELTESETQT